MDDDTRIEVKEVSLEIDTPLPENALWRAFNATDKMLKEQGWYEDYQRREDLEINVSSAYEDLCFNFSTSQIFLPKKMLETMSEKAQESLVVSVASSYYKLHYNNLVTNSIGDASITTAGTISFVASVISLVNTPTGENGIFNWVASISLSLIASAVVAAAAESYGIPEKMEKYCKDRQNTECDLLSLEVVKDVDAIIELIKKHAEYYDTPHPFARIEKIKQAAQKYPEKYSDPENSPAKTA